MVAEYPPEVVKRKQWVDSNQIKLCQIDETKTKTRAKTKTIKTATMITERQQQD